MNPDPARAFIRAFHQRTSHRLDRYAAGPGGLDRDAQPDPFRVRSGTEKVPLPRGAEHIPVPWDDPGGVREAALRSLESLGIPLQLSAAITAWKEYAGSRWTLGANPSSGNPHPTETWVIARGVAGPADGLYHHQPRDHSQEPRASTPPTPGGEGGNSSSIARRHRSRTAVQSRPWTGSQAESAPALWEVWHGQTRLSLARVYALLEPGPALLLATPARATRSRLAAQPGTAVNASSAGSWAGARRPGPGFRCGGR